MNIAIAYKIMHPMLPPRAANELRWPKEMHSRPLRSRRKGLSAVRQVNENLIAKEVIDAALMKISGSLGLCVNGTKKPTRRAC